MAPTEIARKSSTMEFPCTSSGRSYQPGGRLWRTPSPWEFSITGKLEWVDEALRVRGLGSRLWALARNLGFSTSPSTLGVSLSVFFVGYEASRVGILLEPRA